MAVVVHILVTDANHQLSALGKPIHSKSPRGIGCSRFDNSHSCAQLDDIQFDGTDNNRWIRSIHDASFRNSFLLRVSRGQNQEQEQNHVKPYLFCHFKAACRNPRKIFCRE